jgi:hypothetical protein
VLIVFSQDLIQGLLLNVLLVDSLFSVDFDFVSEVAREKKGARPSFAEASSST